MRSDVDSTVFSLCTLTFNPDNRWRILQCSTYTHIWELINQRAFPNLRVDSPSLHQINCDPKRPCAVKTEASIEIQGPSIEVYNTVIRLSSHCCF